MELFTKEEFQANSSLLGLSPENYGARFWNVDSMFKVVGIDTRNIRLICFDERFDGNVEWGSMMIKVLVANEKLKSI